MKQHRGQVDPELTERDLAQLNEHGISAEQACYQLQMLRDGVLPPRLVRPCAIGDGIVKLTDAEVDDYVCRYGKHAMLGTAAKFVPASGAATRMLRALLWVDGHLDHLDGETLATLARREGGHYQEVQSFVKGLPELACFGDLLEVMSRDGLDGQALLRAGEFKPLVNYLLADYGLGYSSLPKALIKFHRYDGDSRTALEEHLAEAADYIRDRDGWCRVHFTVAPRHKRQFDCYLSEIKSACESRYAVRFLIQVSEQDPSTDTIAVDKDGALFRDSQGRILLRPGGHGALLGNLGMTDAEIVFVNNVDDVLHESRRGEACRHKMALGGYLLELRGEIFSLLRQLEGKSIATPVIKAGVLVIKQRLSQALPPDFMTWLPPKQVAWLRDLLDRPLRVCGVVANKGEPGGGPFWVEGPEGKLSLQIVEQAQVDRDCEEQVAIFRASSHFNPVHIVCGLTDYRGERFEVHSFSDPSQAFVAVKCEGDKEVTALELPGLWNGGMALWNTVFVEIPREAFAPVKSICDLLKPPHHGGVD